MQDLKDSLVRVYRTLKSVRAAISYQESPAEEAAHISNPKDDSSQAEVDSQIQTDSVAQQIVGLPASTIIYSLEPLTSITVTSDDK